MRLHSVSFIQLKFDSFAEMKPNWNWNEINWCREWSPQVVWSVYISYSLAEQHVNIKNNVYLVLLKRMNRYNFIVLDQSKIEFSTK